MVKIILLLKRREGMSLEAFREYYEKNHVPLARAQLLPPGIRYVRHYVQPLGEVSSEPYDCVTEVWFADRAQMEATFAKATASDFAAVLADDEAKVFDRATMRYYCVYEEHDS